MRVRHYSYEIEKIYLYWIKQYIYFHNITHPKDLGAAQVEAFLTHLAVAKNVTASTQNQALFVLLFLYREVLKIDLPWLDGFSPAKKQSRVPVVLTKEEVKFILSGLKGTNWLIAGLLYGSGLRLSEALRLRVKDLDFGYRQIIVRDGKGGKSAHASSFVCDASFAGRLRHPHDSGNARTQGTDDNDDLYARSESASSGRKKSG